VQGLPLEMGDNVIEITAYDASGNVATDTVTITRAPIPNLKQPDGIAVDTVNDEILVASTGNSSIVVYARTASGLATPKRIISGASTGLLYPVGIAVDTVNNEILVTDYNFINVYLRTATGDAAPIRTISGAATGLSLPQGIAVDTANDEIFVVNRDWNNMRIMVFPRTASGDAVPIRTIAGTSTNLSSPWSITVDTVNNEIMAIDSDYNCINVYSRSTSGNAAPVRTISGAATGLNHPHGIAVDTAHDEIIAGNGYANIASINAYSRTASGDTAPVRMISGPSTSFYYPYGIAVDTVNDEIFVVNSYSSPLRAYITVYPRSSSGNVAPSRTIFGAYPGL